MQGNAADVVLEVRRLRTHFVTEAGIVPAVDGVDFTVRRGQTLGLVGESGCGKTVTALSVIGLVPPPGRVVEGEVRFGGHDLTRLSERELEKIRGNRISMIFQEPTTSLNPVQTVGDQIAEVLLVHRLASRGDVRRQVCALLGLVGIPNPEQRYDAYPHELSGGMCQRVMIAMALACRPALLIADEPTTALDVTIQAEILDLFQQLKSQVDLAVLLITHDLGVIAEVADEVAVMYAGKIVEFADVHTLFQTPMHPYTQALLASIPTIETPRTERLRAIGGTVPNPLRLPAGCRFVTRCPHAMPICREREPDLVARGRSRVACWLHEAAVARVDSSGEGR